MLYHTKQRKPNSQTCRSSRGGNAETTYKLSKNTYSIANGDDNI